MESKKSCETCKHFLQHYGISHKTLYKVNCGHCLKCRLTKKEYAKFPFWEGCEEWASDEIKISKRNASIQQTMEEIAKQLKNIERLLQDDTIKK